MPSGFMKVRYYGFLHGCSRVPLEKIRASIEMARGFDVPEPASDGEEREGKKKKRRFVRIAGESWCTGIPCCRTRCRPGEALDKPAAEGVPVIFKKLWGKPRNGVAGVEGRGLPMEWETKETSVTRNQITRRQRRSRGDSGPGASVTALEFSGSSADIKEPLKAIPL